MKYFLQRGRYRLFYRVASLLILEQVVVKAEHREKEIERDRGKRDKGSDIELKRLGDGGRKRTRERGQRRQEKENDRENEEKRTRK